MEFSWDTNICRKYAAEPWTFGSKKTEKVHQSAKRDRQESAADFFSFLTDYIGRQDSNCPQQIRFRFAADFWSS